MQHHKTEHLKIDLYHYNC